MFNKRNDYRLKVEVTGEIRKKTLKKVVDKTEKLGYSIETIISDPYEIEIKDLSIGGFQGESISGFEVGDEIQIQIPYISDKNMILIGEILRKDNESALQKKINYHIAFKKLSNKNEQLIANFINRQQLNEMKAKSIEAYDHGDTTSISEKIREGLGERRKKIGFTKRVVPILSLIGWMLVFAILMIIFVSRPLAKDPISLLIGGNISHEWNQNRLYFAYVCSVTLLFFSITSIVVDLSRQSRKEDYKHKSLVIQLCVGVIFTLFFILKLGVGQRGLFK